MIYHQDMKTMNKQEIIDNLESLELQLAEWTNMLYTLRKEIEENLTED